LLYENGHGVPKDLGKARELYQKAANQGNQTAIANLKRLSGQPTESATASRQVSAETPTAIKDQKDKVNYSIGTQIGSNLSRQKVEVNPDVLAAGIKDALAGKPQLSPDRVKEVMTQSPPKDKDKYNYCIGLNIGFNLSQQKVEPNPEVLIAGIKDAIAGKPQLTPDQIKEVMTKLEKATGEKNKTEGAKFLEENKKKSGVKTTASGLQYKVEKEGTGAQPKPTDMVTVNYRATLIDGSEFDSSYKRGQPATFPVNGVIKGWTEALQLMRVGSKYQLFVPSNLAYGERAVGAQIGPNSTLIFEVELLAIKPQ